MHVSIDDRRHQSITVLLVVSVIHIMCSTISVCVHVLARDKKKESGHACNAGGVEALSIVYLSNPFNFLSNAVSR